MLRWRDTKINDIHDFTYTAIFETRDYLVAAFVFGLACAVLRYWLLKVLSVNYLPSGVTKLQDGHRDNLPSTSCMLDDT